MNEYGPKRPQTTTAASSRSTRLIAIIGVSLRRACVIAAPTLAEAEEQGLLPTMEQCTARYAELRAG